MKSQRIYVMRSWLLLLLTGLILFAGPVLEFLPDIAWNDGPIANAMLWHDRQRIEQAVLLLIVAIGAATIWHDVLYDTLANLPKPVRWSLGLGFALGGLSAVLSEFPRFAGLEWATLLLLSCMAFLIAGQARMGEGNFDVWAIRLVVVVSGIIVLRVMMGYLAATIQGVRLDSVALFTSVFSNRRVFGQVASMVMPLLAYPFLVSSYTRLQRWGAFILLALWWMLVIVSGTRGTWMALVVAASILAFFAWRACVRWLRVQATAFGVGALLFWVLFVLLPVWLGQNATIENRLSNIDSLSGRSELWAMAWTHIQAHPWLGIGPMHLAAIPFKYGAHPHNAILQLAAEWGVLATLAIILPALFSIHHLLARLRQQASNPTNVLLMCLSASLLAAGAQSMVDGVIVMPYSQLWVALIAGWTFGVYFRYENGFCSNVVSGYFRFVIPTLSLFALTLLMNGIFPEALYRAQATKAFLDAGNNTVPPRYWMVGRIP